MLNFITMLVELAASIALAIGYLIVHGFYSESLHGRETSLPITLLVWGATIAALAPLGVALTSSVRMLFGGGPVMKFLPWVVFAVLCAVVSLVIIDHIS